MPIITNETLKAITHEIELRNGILQKYAEKYAHSSWEQLQSIVRAGKAAEFYHIGDEFITKATFAGVTYDFPWIIVDMSNAELEDEETVPALWLQAKYATPYAVTFDAAEPANTDTNIRTYGYNRWRDSAYRQWLNSDKGVGEWWTATSDTDVAPNELNTRPGFMTAFDADFINVIGNIKTQTATNTVTDGGVVDVTYDKFFLPSVEQMYGVPQVADAEGHAWQYWISRLGGNPRNDAIEERKIFGIDNKASAQYCRLRSAYRGSSHNVWYGYTAGQLYSSNAYNAYRCAPACVIC